MPRPRPTHRPWVDAMTTDTLVLHCDQCFRPVLGGTGYLYRVDIRAATHEVASFRRVEHRGRPRVPAHPGEGRTLADLPPWCDPTWITRTTAGSTPATRSSCARSSRYPSFQRARRSRRTTCFRASDRTDACTSAARPRWAPTCARRPCRGQPGWPVPAAVSWSLTSRVAFQTAAARHRARALAAAPSRRRCRVPSPTRRCRRALGRAPG